MHKDSDKFMPLEEFAQLIRGAPILAPTQKIEKIEEYFNWRYNLLENYFNGNAKYDFSKSEDILKNYVESEVPFIFLSVDMVESTKRSLTLNPKINSIVNNLFLNEILMIILGMNGNFYNYGGDGLIAFFTQDNILNKIDDAILCSDYIKRFIEDYLNDFLISKNIPPIEFRITINYGKVYVGSFGDSIELNGYNLNSTIKLQNFADKNDIILGSNAVDLAHKNWKKRMKRLKINPRKLKKLGLHEDMKIYRLHNLEGRYD